MASSLADEGRAHWSRISLGCTPVTTPKTSPSFFPVWQPWRESALRRLPPTYRVVDTGLVDGGLTPGIEQEVGGFRRGVGGADDGPIIRADDTMNRGNRRVGRTACCQAQRARSRRASRSLRALPSSASAHRKIRYVSVERPCDHGVPDPRGCTSGESRSPRFQAVASTVADYGKEQRAGKNAFHRSLRPFARVGENRTSDF